MQEKEVTDQLLWNTKTKKQFKHLFRQGVPDKLKRDAIL
jgi:hypothetical protein